MVSAMPSVKTAAVAHLYYADLWPELAFYLRNLPEDAHLYVTMATDSSEDRAVLKDFPRAEIVRFPNVGRDIAPFIALLPELQKFDVVCKIHTKRNIRGNSRWRRELLRGVLDDRNLVNKILETFETRPRLLVVGSSVFYLDGEKYLFKNRALLEQHFGEIPEAFGFFGGTMFWVRPQMLSDFPDRYPTSAFVPHTDIDGHLEHAIERLIGLRAYSEGGEIGLATIDWLDNPKLEIIPARQRGRLNPGIGRIERKRKRASRMRAITRALGIRPNTPPSID
jgi:lipopolysaccharide biosynthesis protein